MPFGDIGFSGYWDASLNRVVGRAGRGLYDMRDGQVQMYKVVVGGATPLGAVLSWNVGDYAYYNGYEWDRLIGQGSLTSQVNALAASYVAAIIPGIIEQYFASLGSVPPQVPGLWLDGNVVVRS